MILSNSSKPGARRLQAVIREQGRKHRLFTSKLFVPPSLVVLRDDAASVHPAKDAWWSTLCVDSQLTTERTDVEGRVVGCVMHCLRNTPVTSLQHQHRTCKEREVLPENAQLVLHEEEKIAQCTPSVHGRILSQNSAWMGEPEDEEGFRVHRGVENTRLSVSPFTSIARGSTYAPGRRMTKLLLIAPEATDCVKRPARRSV